MPCRNIYVTQPSNLKICVQHPNRLNPSKLLPVNSWITMLLFPTFSNFSTFQTICAQCEKDACCDWVGDEGAGHFVKMVHNGIEYGDMQVRLKNLDFAKFPIFHLPFFPTCSWLAKRIIWWKTFWDYPTEKWPILLQVRLKISTTL